MPTHPESPKSVPVPAGAGLRRRMVFLVWVLVSSGLAFQAVHDEMTDAWKTVAYLILIPLTSAGLWWIGERLRYRPAGPRPGWLIAVCTGLPGGLLTAMALSETRLYGYGVFLVIPLLVGYTAGRLHSFGRKRLGSGSTGTVLGAIVVSGVVLFMLKMEGLACIVMAAGAVLFFALLGCGLALMVRMVTNKPEPGILIGVLLLVLLPFTLSLESPPTGVPVDSLTTVIEINAPPEVVWKYIPEFPEIPAARSLTFRAGLACPLRGEITGSGVGAQRRCVLSTGIMEERVTVWEPGRVLEFEVLNTPAPMVEMSPWQETGAHHLDGYFRCHRGRFVLTALPGGRTRVEGTSWFSHNVRPAAYWNFWTRHIVREVHLRVLSHVRQLSEAAAHP